MKRTITFKWGRGIMWDSEVKESQLEVEAEHFDAVMGALSHVMSERENKDNPYGEMWGLASVEPGDRPGIYIGQLWKGKEGEEASYIATITSYSEGRVGYEFHGQDTVGEGHAPEEYFLKRWEPA